jgi:transposase
MPVTLAASVTPCPQPTPADLRRQQRAEKAHDLRQQGWPIKDIARHLACTPKTISRYLQRQLPLAPKHASKSSKLDGYKDHLVQRWQVGCHNAAQLWRDIQTLGFEGRRSIVRQFVKGLRHADALSQSPMQPADAIPHQVTPTRLPSCRQLAWLSAQPLDTLSESQRDLLAKIGAVHPTLKTAVDLAHSFANMVSQRQPEKLDAWLDTVAVSKVSALARFATGLRDDYAAVKAALALPWCFRLVYLRVAKLK